jgi:hypothetical protein
MKPDMPLTLSIAFILTTVLTVWLFYRATQYRTSVLWILCTWVLIQSGISLTGFYTLTTSVPPRFPLLIALPLLTIAGLFLTRKGRQFIDGLDIRTLTLLHIIRIPVEFVLLSLFIHKYIPQEMTFEGRNVDILSGISALFVYYLVFMRKQAGRKLLLAWNVICLGLLINIVAIAVLSLPYPFQQFGLAQPNIALLYFPFTWLPCCVVPLVLLAHMASIRQLLNQPHKAVDTTIRH